MKEGPWRGEGAGRAATTWGAAGQAKRPHRLPVGPPGPTFASVASEGAIKPSEPEFIASTAGEVAAELARRGIAPGRRVTISIEPDEPDDWIAKARRLARPKVDAEGWTDADIDRIIKEECHAADPPE